MICDVVILWALSRRYTDWQPWPPSMPSGSSSDNADMRPRPWSSFQILFDDDFVRWSFSFHRKPPWPPPAQQNFSSLTSLLIMMMCDGPTLHPMQRSPSIPMVFMCDSAKIRPRPLPHHLPHVDGGISSFWCFDWLHLPPLLFNPCILGQCSGKEQELLWENINARKPLLQKFSLVEYTVMHSWNSGIQRQLLRGVFRNQFQPYGFDMVMLATETKR